MYKIEKIILMYKNEEVVSFVIDFNNNFFIESISNLKKLEHFDKAPFGFHKDDDDNSIILRIVNFINRRSVAAQRNDYQDLLKYTGAKDYIELSFKGHGLSLFDHYWYKRSGEDLRYEDINFFENKWDDSFARAVLSGNYEALQNVNLNVPDVVTAGWGVKGWLCEEDGPKLYKIGIEKDHSEEAIGECLASKLALRMFNKGESLEYILKKIYGKYASVSRPLINIDEELVPLASIIPANLSSLYKNRFHDKAIMQKFFEEIDTLNIPGLKEYFIKIWCWRSLAFVSDLHLNNLSAIRNMKTGKIKPAPIFDFGGSFGSTKTGKSILSHINAATYMIVYFSFGDIQPYWDYSWYKPHCLDGFEKEIREYLSLSSFYTPELIDNIIDVYNHQKEALESFALKKDK